MGDGNRGISTRYPGTRYYGTGTRYCNTSKTALDSWIGWIEGGLELLIIIKINFVLERENTVFPMNCVLSFKQIRCKFR
jgi:hypothetical protein